MNYHKDITEEYKQALRQNGVTDERVVDLMVAGFNTCRAMFDEDFREQVGLVKNMLQQDLIH